ncbi:DUF3987 domain-containing protein [Wenyingzhuangia sp. IMCC45574]
MGDKEKSSHSNNEDSNRNSKKSQNKYTFPFHVFPEKIQKVSKYFVDYYSFSPDFLGSCMLLAFSSSIGKSYSLSVLEGWNTYCNLFLVIVGDAGTCKTPVMKLCMKPLKDIDKEIYKEYKSKCKDYSSDKESKIKKPSFIRLLYSDFTPEVLMQALEESKKSVTIYVDEILSWLKNMNRYQSSGELESYLSLWSGNSFTKDRVSLESISVEKPFSNVLGGIQPKKINELMRNGNEDNGFVDRILFAYPEQIDKNKWPLVEGDSEAYKLYSEVINKLYNLKGSRVLNFSEAARKKLFNWQHSNQVYNFEGFELGASAKLEEYSARFSLLLQVLSDVTLEKESTVVGVDAVEGAMCLVEYFYENTFRIRSKKHFSYLDTLTKEQLHVYTILNEEFTTSDMKNAVKGFLRERAMYNFLNNTKLFERVSKGHYKKIIKIIKD